MKVTPVLLKQVAKDNIAANQIGDDFQDGIGWRQGEDLGFMRPEDAARLPISDEAARGVAPQVGRLTIAQMNDNERAHIAQARADRRASGF